MTRTPVTPEQVQAAVALHERMAGWRNTDAALVWLAKTSPSFDGPSCLLKAVTINALYGTQIRAIVRMAAHVENVLSKHDLANVGPEVVHSIAEMPAAPGEGRRLFISFAAKFCHFFIDASRFPIYDDAARSMLRFHLGPDVYVVDKKAPYKSFNHAFALLRAQANVCGDRDLDRYLWIAGMYARWLRQRSKKNPLVNAELRRLFENPSREERRHLDMMLPAPFERIPEA